MLRFSALLLFALAALPATAQVTTSADGTLLTPAESVAFSWFEALSTLDAIAGDLDEFPDPMADEHRDALNMVAQMAALTAGGVVEASRFSVALAGPGPQREAAATLLHDGFGLAFVLGVVATAATAGTDDGAEPDWRAHAAMLREQAAQVRASLDALGIALP